MNSQAFLLISAVVAVGVLHTLVPDHWAPIVVIARQRGWTKVQTARAALIAGSGHTITTLILGAAVWFSGAELGMRFGHLIDLAASAALIALGLWIAIGSSRELRRSEHGHSHGHGHGYQHYHDHDDLHHHLPEGTDGMYARLTGFPVAEHHVHMHQHGRGQPHSHWHDHDAQTAHIVTAAVALHPPMHDHRHRLSLQAGLLILLGSSPMVEGLPAFFAASHYSFGFLALMAAAFAISTIVTYVVLCSVSLAGLERVKLGPLERYSEVISGAFIATVGLIFLVWPVA